MENGAGDDPIITGEFTGTDIDLSKITLKWNSSRTFQQRVDNISGTGTELRIEGIVSELYDVVVLPNVVRPMAVGFKTDEIRRTVTIGPQVD